MMKKVSLFAVALLLVCLLSACAAEEALTEQVLHGLLGADVDLSDDNIALVTETGETFTIGTAWPEELNDRLPKCEDGVVEAATVWNGQGFLTVSGLTEEQFKTYLAKFEKMNIPVKAGDSTEQILRYTATKEADYTITLSYYKSDEKLVISVTEIAE